MERIYRNSNLGRNPSKNILVLTEMDLSTIKYEYFGLVLYILIEPSNGTKNDEKT